jgi:phosphopantetheinyl transferase
LWGDALLASRIAIFPVHPNLPPFSWRALDVAPGCTLALLIPGVQDRAEPHAPSRSAAVQVLLRRVLGQLTRTAPDALRIGRTERGKPYLESLPSIRFSVSHARAYSVLAISCSGEVGCDVEDRLEAGDMQRLGALVLHAQEIEDLGRLEASESQVGFLRCWVRKEALLKAQGAGFLDDPRQVLARDTRFILHEKLIGPGCAAAVASADRECAWHLLALAHVS